MKRLSAIVLSLLLFWVQVVVMAQPPQAKAQRHCCGCACQKANCCLTPFPTDSAPLPVATVQTGATFSIHFSFTASIAWLLPRGEADLSSADRSSSLPAACVPLFRRDCALLI